MFPGGLWRHNTSPEAHSDSLSVVVCQLVPSVKAIRGVWGPSGPLSQLAPLCNIYTDILKCAPERHRDEERGLCSLELQRDRTVLEDIKTIVYDTEQL